tara:strand:- start:113 stop:1048 length:936 start_codon:yes stop_codon:yes gene_type:complete
MNTNSRLLFVIILFVGMLCASYPGSAFNYGTNAREISLSKSMVSVYNSGFNAFNNPANLSQVQNNEYGFSYFMMSLDRSIQSFSISRALPPTAGVGLSFFRAGTDNIISTNSFGSENGSLSSYEGYGMLSFGISFGKLSLGYNIKTFIHHLSEYNANGIGFDLGLLYKAKNLNFGIKVNNLSSSYSWEIEEAYEEDIPINYSMGLSYYKFENILLSTQINMLSIINDPLNNNQELLQKFFLGIEYKLMKNNFSNLFRFGINEVGNKINFSLGLGFPIQLKENKTLNCDYAIVPGIIDEGISHFFSITFINY